MYVINFDNYESIGTHWITFYVNGNNNAIYFDTYAVRKELKNVWEIKISWQIFKECKHMIRLCVDAFVLDLLILY